MIGIKLRREEVGMSRVELALCIGVGANTIWRYEKGLRKPGIETLKQISVALKCTIDKLVNPTPPPVAQKKEQQGQKGQKVRKPPKKLQQIPASHSNAA